MYKLIRDKVPEIMENNGEHCFYGIAEDSQLFSELIFLKLVEEIGEVKQAKTKHERLAELGDVYALLEILATDLGVYMEEVENAARVKESTNGGFTKKYIGFFNESYNEDV